MPTTNAEHGGAVYDTAHDLRAALNDYEHAIQAGTDEGLLPEEEAEASRELLRDATKQLDELVSQRGRYQKTLKRILQWDCLNPTPAVHLCADFPWLKSLVEAALADAPGTTQEANVADVTAQLVPALDKFSPEQRLEVLDAVTDLWCPYCGYEHRRDPKRRECQCSNDE